MLIATAGHIDHGKTALVRALTGVETDRLPEEKARGISIDLGFAYWRPDGGATIGFIDVPGHERFIRNMLAGFSGVEFALLVIAADDGMMPQTIEHLRILDLLGISRGAVALTKCDRATPDQIVVVRSDLGELLAESGLADAPLFEVSSLTGAGIEPLAQALIAERDKQAASADTGHGFRLAVDRAFSVSGAGTIITGTAVSGRIAIGAALTLSPSGREVRVRGLQSGGEKVDEIAAGQRGAINLTGIEVSDLHRGDWLVEPALYCPTTRIEAHLQILPPLRHAAHVHLHIGAADIGARVLTPRQRTIPPGELGLVQLLLDAPTSAIAGQRFVLRDQSGRVLVGGGTVLDPLVQPKRRTLEVRRTMAQALALPDPAAALTALAAIPGLEPASSWFARCRNLMPAAMQALLNDGDFVLAGEAGDIVITRSRFDRLAEALLKAVGQYHIDHPEAGGITRRQARLALDEAVSTELLTSLLHRLACNGKINASGTLLRLPGHSASFNPMEIALWRGVLAMLEDGPPRTIALSELARELRASEAAVRAMLTRRRINGDVWQVTDNKFMLRDHIATLAATAARLDAAHTGFTAAQFRDASGIGRNFVIQLLEFFDRIGVTRRIGELRRIRGDYAAVVGEACPDIAHP